MLIEITIIAVGSMAQRAEQKIAQYYLKQANAIATGSGIKQIKICQIKEANRKSEKQRKNHEATLIKSKIPDKAFIISLDKSGNNIKSDQFASTVLNHDNIVNGKIIFLIGGSDGLEQSLLQQSHLKIAFGSMTWPHQLARIMLLEQIYRSICIKKNKPYHKE